MIDDNGKEMMFVTLSISNSGSRILYVKTGGRPIEAKVADRWTGMQAMEGTLGILRPLQLQPSQHSERLLLLPAGADTCRVPLEFTAASFTGPLLSKGRLGWFAQELPTRVRFRLPWKFWGWVGYPRYGPSSHWREISAQLPLPPTTPRPLGTSTEDRGR